MAALSLNLIQVGADQFTAADRRTIGDAFAYLQGTFATVGLLVRVQYYEIPTAAAGGRDIINNDGEAEALTIEWTVPNSAVDVFLVRTYVGTIAGLSPTGGSCDKQAPGMSGAVVELVGSLTGQVLAHEVGHYLGLAHVPGIFTNLMYPTVQNGGMLTNTQGITMRSHCFVER
jgi:hypothetical protein